MPIPTPARKLYSLRETVYQSPGQALTVDGNCVRDVKICGFKSARGREYPPSVLKSAVERGLYESKFSNTDHTATAAGNPQSTPFAARFGWTENARFVENDGVRGDYRFNPDHPYAKSFIWWAQNKPEAIGLSHDADGEGDFVGSTFRVKHIESIATVDLVADPASNTRGLLESSPHRNSHPEPIPPMLFKDQIAKSKSAYAPTMRKLLEAMPGYSDSMMAGCGEDGAPMMAANGAGATPEGDHKADIMSAISKLLDSPAPHDQALVKILMKALMKHGAAAANRPDPMADLESEIDGIGGDEGPIPEAEADGVDTGDEEQIGDEPPAGDGETPPPMPEKKEKKKDMPESKLIGELASLKKEVDALRVERQATVKLAEAKRLCSAAKLPEFAITEDFIADLTTKPDGKAMQSAIDARRQLVESAVKQSKGVKPVSNGPGAGDPANDDAAFNHFIESTTAGAY